MMNRINRAAAWRTLAVACAAALSISGNARAEADIVLECTGGPEAAAIYQYRINPYKRAVNMARLVGNKTIDDPVFLLDGKRDTAVKFIDNKILLVYANEMSNTFTIVLPLNGGSGNMKIGNIAGEKDHLDGYPLTCARK